MKNRIHDVINTAMNELVEISEFLYRNPELGYQEYKAVALLTERAAKHEFIVERGIYGIDTAFRAVYDSAKKGPKIAFLCEYDALPGIGHGCGHNLIAAMGFGAAIGLKAVIDDIGGSIVILGTPAEETDGGKIPMVEKGAFADIDVAMMVHPNSITEESGVSLAKHALQFEFTGKTAHAAQSPEKGINALDAVIQTFNGVNALRQHVTDDVRIHGIITEGGKAPNIVPDYAVAQFYVRAADNEKRDIVAEKVIACAQGAALSTGATLKVFNFEKSFDALKTNGALSTLFNSNLRELGEKEIHRGKSGVVSLDMGNVSYAVPSIHPWIGLGNPELVLHTKEFADFTQTELGKKALFKGACALAMTAYDVLSSPKALQNIRREFESES